MCPGRLKSAADAEGSARAQMVAALSAAEMPAAGKRGENRGRVLGSGRAMGTQYMYVWASGGGGGVGVGVGGLRGGGSTFVISSSSTHVRLVSSRATEGGHQSTRMGKAATSAAHCTVVANVAHEVA
jgi:hypothetical protein